MADYATLLRDHVTLGVRPIDRILLQAYVPKLQSVGLVCLFLNRQRGYKIPSSAALGQIRRRYAEPIERWAKAEGIPLRHFEEAETTEAAAGLLIDDAA